MESALFLFRTSVGLVALFFSASDFCAKRLIPNTVSIKINEFTFMSVKKGRGQRNMQSRIKHSFYG